MATARVSGSDARHNLPLLQELEFVTSGDQTGTGCAASTRAATGDTD